MYRVETKNCDSRAILLLLLLLLAFCLLPAQLDCRTRSGLGFLGMLASRTRSGLGFLGMLASRTRSGLGLQCLLACWTRSGLGVDSKNRVLTADSELTGTRVPSLTSRHYA